MGRSVTIGKKCYTNIKNRWQIYTHVLYKPLHVALIVFIYGF